ncbi:SufE family protein [bacterium]|nr:SufE family protein [bacterium]
MIEERIREIVEEIDQISDKFLIYEYLISRGEDLPEIPQEQRTEQQLVHGCQSPLWFDWEYVEFQADSKQQNIGKLVFRAYSESKIVRGIAEIIIYIFQNQTPHKIRSSSSEFLYRLGLNGIISSRRIGGLTSLVEQIKEIAYKLDVDFLMDQCRL